MDLLYYLSKVIPVRMKHKGWKISWWQWRDRIYRVRVLVPILVSVLMIGCTGFTEGGLELERTLGGGWRLKNVANTTFSAKKIVIYPKTGACSIEDVLLTNDVKAAMEANIGQINAMTEQHKVYGQNTIGTILAMGDSGAKIVWGPFLEGKKAISLKMGLQMVQAVNANASLDDAQKASLIAQICELIPGYDAKAIKDILDATSPPQPTTNVGADVVEK